MARTTLAEALDRLAEAAADVTDLTSCRTADRPLAAVVLDLEDAAGSGLGPADGDADVVLLRRLDRARRLLLASRATGTSRPAAMQAC